MNLFIIISWPLSSEKKCLILFFILFKTKKGQLWTKLTFLFFKYSSTHSLVSSHKLFINPKRQLILCKWRTKIRFNEELPQSGIQDFFLISCTNPKWVSRESLTNLMEKVNQFWTKRKYHVELQIWRKWRGYSRIVLGRMYYYFNLVYGNRVWGSWFRKWRELNEKNRRNCIWTLPIVCGSVVSSIEWVGFFTDL